MQQRRGEMLKCDGHPNNTNQLTSIVNKQACQACLLQWYGHPNILTN